MAGHSYNKISVMLGRNKSTISGWCSDIVRPRSIKPKTSTLILKDEPRKKPPSKGFEAQHPYKGYKVYIAGRRKDGMIRYHLVRHKPTPRSDIFIMKDIYEKHVSQGFISDEPKRKKQPRYKECVICEIKFNHPNKRRETCSDACLKTLQSMIRADLASS